MAAQLDGPAVASLVELLRHRAAERSGQGYTFLADGEREEAVLSYEELDRRARLLGALLQRRGLAGRRVLMVYPAGLEYVVGFFGCLYAGAVAVPTYPPQPSRGAGRLLALARDACPGAVLTTTDVLRRLEGRLGPELEALGWLATDALDADSCAEWEEPAVGPDTLAFLQYTSGSTSSPKGVMVSHGNLLHNEEMIRRAFGQTASSVIVGWLPLYHDMGLIGNVLQPLYTGARCVLMSPVSFLQQPARWLRAIARYRATTSGGPDFAYELCVRKVDAGQRAELDLSSWELAYSGAEPVRSRTLERFSSAFAGCGFRREAFYPCYGLAEATLFVVGGSRGTVPTAARFDAAALEQNRAVPGGDDGGRTLVGCGHAWAGQRIAIVDPESRRICAPGTVGEIWVAGPSVAQGYWGRPEVTREVFQASLARGEGPFLRTGDLGFLKGEELFITGRLKDLIILRGRNLYPQDIELTAERSHPSLRPGCGAAFAIEVDGEEKLVVVQEMERQAGADLDVLAAAIRRSVAEEHEAQVHAVVLLRAATIPKTTSGKIQRHACRAGYLAGTLSVVGASVSEPRKEEPAPALDRDGLLALPAEERQRALGAWLRERIAARARVPVSRIDPGRPVTETGLDSLGSVELNNDFQAVLGVALPLSTLLDGSTPSAMAGALLALLKEPGSPAEPLVALRDGACEAPLSWGQKGLWLDERLAPESAAYNLAAAARVQGSLNVAALRCALAALARRHRALRTTFSLGPNGEPVQRWPEGIEVPLVEERVSSAEAAARLDDAMCRPFDLERGPLWRAGVLRLESGETRLYLVIHHLIADFWSMGVLARDLGALYRQETGGGPALLAPLEIEYADYVRWQERTLAGPHGERLRAGWRALLDRPAPALELPADRPRPVQPSYRGGARAAHWDAGLAGAARGLAVARGATLFTVILAAFQALLHRYTGSARVPVGSPTSGRGAAGLEGLAGYFVNPVVLEADLQGDPSFVELLERVRRAALAAFDLQGYPFPRLVEELQPSRDPDLPPFFSVMLVFQRPHLPDLEGLTSFALGAEGGALDLGGLALESVRLEPRRTRFPLALAAGESPAGGLQAVLRYACDLFDRATAERMLGHFRSLLEGIAADPVQRISELPLLSAAERHQVLVEWQGARRPELAEGLIHQAFEEQARQQPEAVAVLFEGETLSYGELNRRANRVAWRLRRLGVGAESRVALCLERSPEMVVALLAVLKAGGAYVPLDPDHPVERLRDLWQGSGAAALLARPGLVDLGVPAERVVDPAGEALASEPVTDPAPLAAPDNLAYVMYTSGTTGRPKGVMVPHRGVVSHLRWRQAEYGLGEEDCLVQKAPLGFDASVWEVLWPLSVGARLVVARPGGHQDTAYLVDLVQRERVTFLHAVPSLLRVLLEEPGFAACSCLRRVTTGGEPLPVEARERFFALLEAELVHGYGPTEASIGVTYGPCERGSRRATRLGQPILNAEIHLLDRSLDPVPLGAAGELCIGGVGVARGYLDRPGLTAERFVPHPFSTVPGARLYRSGDLVRRHADGGLEFLGRIDHQVKIRGMRVEPGEIESVLATHPAVREAVVIPREERPGDKRLVAYVASRAGIEPQELRVYLAARLPAHMVPAAFVVLEALPLMASGKVDRQALARIAPDPASLPARVFVAPRSPIEETLAQIFREVLEVDRVGIHDDFFELGGHSLLATRLISRLRQALGVELSVRAVFVSPTVEGLAGAVATAAAAALPPIERVPRDGPLPLSFGQSRFWFIHQLDPDSPSYNMPCSVRLAGALRPAALAAALGEIVRRHEVLRTTFPTVDGQPVQAVAPPLPPSPLPWVDLAGLPEGLRQTEVARLTREEAQRPFDLGRGPLLRSFLMLESAQEHVLLVTLHHIASDGWSTGVLTRELGTLYRAFAAGQPSPLPELPVQYADFAHWQRRWLSGEVLAEQLSYWRRQLAALPDGLDLPLDRPRPALPALAGGLRALAFPHDLQSAAHRLGREHGATFFMVMLAVFATLLSRITRQTDVVLGSPIANRNRVEVEDLIGFFVNTLVLRVDTAGPPTFVELLQQVREVALGAATAQDVPFERLVEELVPERSLSRTPLFQVVFVVQNAPSETLVLPGLSLQVMPVHTRTSKFDLTLTLSETDAVPQATLEYRTALFDASTVDRLLAHLLTLTGAAVADPGAPISRLTILTEAERHQIELEWNAEGSAAESARRGPRRVHELFEARVRRAPEAIALVWRDLRLDSRELNQRANRLAHRLRRLGVGPETLVGVSLERGPDMIVALLAVLKAGGAYVPLDPGYPEQRLSWILEDARIAVMLTRRALLERLPGYAGQAFCFDTDGPLLAAEPDVDPAAPWSAHQLAYVLYTSGSTGRPKGVLIEHRSVLALLDWAAGLFTPEELAGTLAATSINFDLSVFEIFLPLACGGTVILAEDALALADLAVAGEVTLVNTVPSAMSELVRMGRVPPSVRTVNLAGEALSRVLVDDLYRIPTVRKVYNLYGPSEDTTYSTWALLGRDEAGAPPIGRPLPGSQLYLVDPDLRSVPLGAPGEIVLGGLGLARGYLGRPDLTAERFVPDPFGAGPGGRLYRTGDLGKLLPTGQVAFLGRIDHQVKIRGFRIELGEVESVLLQHPGVEGAAVLALGESAERHLAAWVVPRRGDAEAPAPSDRELRAFLRDRLPDSMVPPAFVFLERLPLTPNGKLDRRALPAPDRRGGESEPAAPRTPVEELVAAVWAEVLGLDRVGVEDSFFDLGGHSLLATQVISRLRAACGVELALRQLFSTPTVRGLAAAVEEELRAGLVRAAEPIRRVPRQESLPLSFAQQRLWFIDQLEPGSSAYTIAGAVALEGRLDEAVLAGALSGIVARHEVLRTHYEALATGPVQVVGPVGPLRLPVVDLEGLPPGERGPAARRRLAEEARRPFDLARGPLLRALLLRLAPEEHILLLLMHHSVSDGWSLGLLIREASVLYAALLEGRPPALPELPVQYADFALWQRERLQGEVLARQLEWWKAHLAGAPAVLELPADRPRPAVRSTRGGRVALRLEPEVARELAALSRRQGATLFMACLTAFEMLLARLSGRTDLVVGTPIAGRVRAELEDLVGLFVNTLALRGDLSGDPSFSELLARVRGSALGAYAHQELPFEKLVEELAPERNLTHTPLFQVLFVFQNAPRGVLELPGLLWRRLEVEGGSAKFDLTLTLSEEEDGVVGGLSFHRDLFDETTVRRWAGHLKVLLAGIVREPQARLSERELLAPSERHQILLAWNDTARAPVTRTVHALFAEQARRTPQAVALRFEGEELTYGELDQRSNRLARFLQGYGVGPDVLVGLCLERSLEMVVGVLGILKAGGAFVPLDPGYPPERLAYMLEDAGAPVLLSHSSLLDRLPGSAAERILLDTDWERVAGQSAADPGAPVEPDHLACVLYTSGSTGRPKGVMDPHRSVMNQILWLQATYRLDATDRVLQKTPISWDVSLWELFWPLTSGATLVLALPGGHQDPSYMAATLEQEGITTVHFVPSMLRLFLDLVEARSFPRLRRVVSSGEALTLDLEERFFSAFRVDLNNMYGPGESARASLWRCERGNDRAVAPIGRPTHDVQLYVLDRRLEPVPIGVAGELYVGGQSLARGYHRRPDLTAEKFLPNPFGADPGLCVYRTGDLARTMADGTLEFLGRIDHQVKIRGVRIELGEIESVLGQHPGVADAVVVARPAGSGEKRLAAYVVPEGELDALGIEELREHLRSKLPDYMVPESWVFLDALPLAPNGKADRERLPEPQWVSWQRDYVAPNTLAEELLATVWAELLGLERVGARDGFFELGGNSLLATQVASRVRSVFGVEMPLRTVFERPTLADLAEAVSDLLRRERGSVAPPLVPVPRTGPLPLSFAQERLWFIEQLDPGRPVYHMPATLRLEGRLDRAALAWSLSELVRRHEALRSRFPSVEGRPAQVVEPASPVPLPLVDLGGLPLDRREEEGRRLAVDEARRPFDLAHGPLLRATLVRLEESAHLALLTLHHIVSDGWSTGVLVRELSALYGAGLAGLPSPLPELPVQYADFAGWQRGWLQGEVLERELGYWRERLAGAPPVLELPVDRPRPALRSLRGGSCPLQLPEALSQSAAALARQRGATLFMVLLAAFDALLHRCTEEEDLSVGTPIAGRNRMEIEGLIGFFVNTLVLRAAVSGADSGAAVLERIRDASLGAYAHQDVPFERVVEELQPERSLSHTPLFQVMFALQSAPRPPLELPGLTLSPVAVDSGTAKFDLTLTLGEVDGRLMGGFQYASDLFELTTVERMGRHLEALLAGMLHSPHAALSELPLAGEPERHQLLHEWNDTRQDLPFETTLHRLAERQAEATPRADAFVFEGERLSHGELDLRANRLANHLRRLGVERGDLVAVCAERSFAMVVALLGVLKAGAAYVPLDPEYPVDRLAFMLEDTGAPVVLTQAHLEPLLPDLPVRRVRLDADWPEIARESAARPQAGAGPDDLAYVIYTSGSTGRPKGVQVPHRGVVNRLLWAQQAYPVGPGDRILIKASFSFDFSVWEVFAPLLAGAAGVLARPGGQRDSAYLAQLLREQSVSLVHFVPSMLQAFLAEEDLTGCDSLRFVFAGGERLTAEILERYHARVPAPLRNQYGPTEASIDVLDWLCRPGDPARRSVPVGRPLANAVVRVVDRYLQPAPIGIPGELLIGGPAVSRGYLGRPALTAERFIPAPFAAEPGARVYRTGDLVRWAEDGTLEFLGRVDHQVKVRGFRIEPGEIEAALRSHPAVAEAAVLAREDGPGGARLVAYVVWDAAGGEPPSTRELRERLREQLPEFMVPAAFVPLETMPLNPSGKADRRALARIAPAASAPPGSGEAPAALTPVQEIVAGLWRDVLGLDRSPGAEDHFFELGGHSLLATQVISRVRQALGVDVPLRSLFEAPTVAGLAGVVERALQAGAGLAVPPLVPRARDRALPLSFAQERLWFVSQLLPESSHYNMPSAIRLEGALDPVLLARALEEIVRRHEVLRTSFPAPAGEPVQRIAPPAPFELPWIDLGGLPPERRLAEARRLAAADARRPFDLTRGPVLRAALVRLDERDHAGLFTLHHIVSDGWSRSVFLEELTAIYGALREGRPSPLPPLAVQYADFAAWQRSWLRGEALEAQLSYWRGQLAAVPPLELPLDRPRPAVQLFRAGRVAIQLPPALSEGLRRLAGSRGVTLYMALLAGFAALAQRCTGQDDFALGSPIANRNRTEIEDLIGFFVNSLVLRVRLDGDPDFQGLLARVREVALQAYAHQDLPFEKLVEELQPERSLSRNPLFQVVLALQNTPLALLDLPGLTVSPLGPEGGATRFDLEIHLWDLPDGLKGMALYDRELFDPTTVARLVSHFERLLEEAVADPGRALSELPLLTGPERAQLLWEWNDTAVDFGPFAGVRQRFEARVLETPEALAVAMGGDGLSYRELDLRANRLAHHLRALGAGPEEVVGICLERSADWVVAVLAAVKTGGAYLPLDPAYPVQRLDFMLRDAGALALVTRERLAPGLEGSARHVVKVDDDREAIAARGSGAPPAVCLPEGLAYVIYTSGSTGRPKGVALTQAGLANLVSWHQRSYRVTPHDRATQLAGSAFDASVWEVWPYLTAGASLHLPDEAVRAAAPDLLRWLAAERVTLSFLPTPLAEACLRQPAPPGLALSAVLTGGDKLHRLLEEPPYRLVNHYGPTESTVVASCAPVADREDRDPSIGRPIDNLRIHLVDRQLQPVPIGVPGELLIAGLGLARGYLRQPDLTAGRFVPDPFGEPGGRLYRTGDLARWRGDANLEFLGRIDHQVKLRGFRIELGEIEALLQEHSGVAACAVLAREDVPGQQRLVAYVVPGREPVGPAAGEAGEEQVEQWQTLYDQTYEQGRSGEDAAFNVVGWNSSYTGEPIPPQEMREWVERTVEEILDLSPRRVLEIGVGTGLLLHRIAPGCALYHGVDFSQTAIDWLKGLPIGKLPQVHLEQRVAHDFAGIEPRAYDSVVINSVVQYFPGADYLATVLEQAVESVADGGFVYVGDVRSLPLLDAFHASVELHRAEETVPIEALGQRVQAQRMQEAELVLDPGFFSALARRVPRITGVEVRPKRGRADNELTRFRYQVILRIGDAGTAPAAPAQTLDWDREGLDLDGLLQLLEQGRPESLALLQVPNARTTEVTAIARLLAEGEGPRIAGDVREQLREQCSAAVHPDDLHELGESLGYEVDVQWARPGAEGRFEVLFRRPGSPARLVSQQAPGLLEGSWSRWANDPLLGKSARRLVPELRSWLQGMLADHMVPSAFVLLEALPLTPNGKLDRRALPAPEHSLRGSETLPPRDALELQLVRLWEEILEVRPVGIRDNFFELGGHSLMAVQLLARVEHLVGRPASVAALFQNPTVEGLAALLRQAGPAPGRSLVTLQPAGSPPPLYLVHPGGGTVLGYLDLVRYLGDDQPVHGLQSVGLDGALAPVADIGEMAARYLAEMAGVHPGGPYFLAGWSLGGIVAFEMAQQLRAQGEEVACLALVDTWVATADGPPSDLALLAGFAGDLGLSPRELDLPVEELERLDDAARLARLESVLRERGKLPPDAGFQQLQRLFEVFRSNVLAARRYVPRPYPGRVVLIAAEEQPPERCGDPSLGWAGVAAGGLVVDRVPGNHVSMLREPRVRVLAERLRSFLKQGGEVVEQKGFEPSTPMLRL